ncbi:hypothetical protein V8G54_028446, partial [Vigna mungo]
MQLQNYTLFLWCYLSPLEIRPQIIHPPQSAALPISFQPCKPRNRVPSSFTMQSDILNKQPVFFSSPWSLPPYLLLHHTSTTYLATQNFPPIHAVRVPSLFL